MKKLRLFLSVQQWHVACLLLLFMVGCKKRVVEQERMCARIDMERIVALLPKTPEDIQAIVDDSKQQMQTALREISLVAPNKRNYLNTVLQYEQTYLQFYVNMQVLGVLAALGSDVQLQLAAHLALQDLRQYQIDHMAGNQDLYESFSQYSQYGKDPYHATKPVQNFLLAMDEKGLQEGIKLSVEDRTDLQNLQKEATKLCGQYYGNVLYDNRQMMVSFDQLRGVPQEVLQSLPQDKQGNYVLSSELSLFFTIMETCDVLETRKAYYKMFGQIGYPQNEPILKNLMKVRKDIAKIYGFANYADYQISSLMMKSGKKVEQFLWSMVKELQPYVQKDYQRLLKNLPPSVTLTSKGQLQPWDDAYVKSMYRKKYYQIDDHELAQYFPVDHVVPAMLAQFKKFFHVNFEADSSEGLWAPDLQVYAVRSLKTQAILGYLILDLYNRPGKQIADAMHMMLVPTIRDDCSIACVGASVVAAQFTAGRDGQPSLLQFSDVISLFHELGHGLHALFGATRFTMFSGTQVVQDFVETPSLMLEYWFDEPEMLAAISQHVHTQQPLPHSQIQKLIAAQKFGRAGRMMKQLYLALVSYNLFKDSVDQNIPALLEKLHKKLFTHVVYDPSFHIETSFTHLVQQYAAAYYTYPLSSVIAADLFAKIKEHGLFNYLAGEKYVADILSSGGSIPPQTLIKRFLGRNFNNHAYMSML